MENAHPIVERIHAAPWSTGFGDSQKDIRMQHIVATYSCRTRKTILCIDCEGTWILYLILVSLFELTSIAMVNFS
jgi:hypothetical protein